MALLWLYSPPPWLFGGGFPLDFCCPARACQLTSAEYIAY
jgi:hypothetical protein